MKKIASLLLALLLLCAGLAFAEEATEEAEIVYGPAIGCTLYTVRNEYNAMREEQLAAGATEQEAATYALTECLRRIAAMGYTAYQPNHANTNWYLMDAAELKALNEELGLTCISPHMVTAWSMSDEELTDFLLYLDAIDATGISLDTSSPEEEGWEWGDRITQDMILNWTNQIIEKMTFMRDKIDELGLDLKVGFHAHSYEWIPVEAEGGRYMLDILYGEFGKEFDWHFDTSHMVYPNVGFDAIYPYDFPGEEGLIEYLWAHGNQYNFIHFKDVDCEGYYTTAIGQGDIEWNEVLRACAYHGIQLVLVEDNAPGSYNRDAFGSLQVSINYLNDMYHSLGLTRPDI